MKRCVIVVAGNKYHGKDALSDRLLAHLPNARRDSYILPLRVAVHAKTGIPWEVLNGPNTVKDDPRFGRYGKSARQFLIEEGDHIRTKTDIAALVHRLSERVGVAPEPITVVSDGRMPETEIGGLRAALDKQGAYETIVIAVRVVRPSVDVDMSHSTESEIANAPADLFDYTVCNDGDLDALAAIAGGICDEILVRLA
jgi:hypothetical protein